MAKFVDTTWAACLARQKPVSTARSPACMKMTSTAPMTTQSRLTCCPLTGSIRRPAHRRHRAGTPLPLLRARDP